MDTTATFPGVQTRQPIPTVPSYIPPISEDPPKPASADITQSIGLWVSEEFPKFDVEIHEHIGDITISRPDHYLAETVISCYIYYIKVSHAILFYENPRCFDDLKSILRNVLILPFIQNQDIPEYQLEYMLDLGLIYNFTTVSDPKLIKNRGPPAIIP